MKKKKLSKSKVKLDLDKSDPFPAAVASAEDAALFNTVGDGYGLPKPALYVSHLIMRSAIYGAAVGVESMTDKILYPGLNAAITWRNLATAQEYLDLLFIPLNSTIENARQVREIGSRARLEKGREAFLHKLVHGSGADGVDFDMLRFRLLTLALGSDIQISSLLRKEVRRAIEKGSFDHFVLLTSDQRQLLRGVACQNDNHRRANLDLLRQSFHEGRCVTPGGAEGCLTCLLHGEPLDLALLFSHAGVEDDGSQMPFLIFPAHYWPEAKPKKLKNGVEGLSELCDSVDRALKIRATQARVKTFTKDGFILLRKAHEEMDEFMASDSPKIRGHLSNFLPFVQRLCLLLDLEEEDDDQTVAVKSVERGCLLGSWFFRRHVEALWQLEAETFVPPEALEAVKREMDEARRDMEETFRAKEDGAA